MIKSSCNTYWSILTSSCNIIYPIKTISICLLTLDWYLVSRWYSAHAHIQSLNSHIILNILAFLSSKISKTTYNGMRVLHSPSTKTNRLTLNITDLTFRCWRPPFQIKNVTSVSLDSCNYMPSSPFFLGSESGTQDCHCWGRWTLIWFLIPDIILVIMV